MRLYLIFMAQVCELGLKECQVPKLAIVQEVQQHE